MTKQDYYTTGTRSYLTEEEARYVAATQFAVARYSRGTRQWYVVYLRTYPVQEGQVTFAPTDDEYAELQARDHYGRRV